MGDSAEIPAPSELCAGGIVFDDSQRLLMIRRGQPPAQGRWSVPGGRCRPGEPGADACVREVAEETGLAVSVSHLAGRVVRARPGGGSYLIDDFVCRLDGGVLRAGDDAVDARWFDRAELAAYAAADELAPLLWETLADWELLPR